MCWTQLRDEYVARLLDELLPVQLYGAVVLRESSLFFRLVLLPAPDDIAELGAG